MRPIFLASCVVACKVTHDGDLRLRSLQSKLMDVFNLLELGLLVKLEHQLLEVLHASQQPPVWPVPRSLTWPLRSPGAAVTIPHGGRLPGVRGRALPYYEQRARPPRAG